MDLEANTNVIVEYHSMELDINADTTTESIIAIDDASLCNKPWCFQEKHANDIACGTNPSFYNSSTSINPSSRDSNIGINWSSMCFLLLALTPLPQLEFVSLHLCRARVPHHEQHPQSDSTTYCYFVIGTY
jgi:hypothetical protein